MTKHGILDLRGATCATCAFTVEHVGRKIKGVDHIRVQADEQKIYVDYEEGHEPVLEKIAGIVRKIGYEASIATEDAKV